MTTLNKPMEENKQRKELEGKMKEMWKVIEDLKNKVMEEKELLKKEKIENEKLAEEQNKLRKQLVNHLHQQN